MSCKTCKSYDEDEKEMLIVHLWQSHGTFIDPKEYPHLDWKRIEELKNIHKDTGRKSASRFNIKPS